MLKKRKRMGQKAFFSKKSKRGYQRLFCICSRQVSNKRMKTSNIHIAPCSHEIIDNENPIFFNFFFWKCEMRLFGCHGNNNCFSFHGNRSVFKIKETGQFTYFRMDFPVLFSFMTYYRVCKYSNATGATSCWSWWRWLCLPSHKYSGIR